MRGAVLAVLLACLVPAAASGQRRAPDAEEYDELFRKYSKRFFGVGFDWRLFKAQGMAESNLRADARSHVGARGIMQLMPRTYEEVRAANPELRAIDHPESNIAAGIQYDRKLWLRWEGHEEQERLRFMLGGYNAGRGTLLRAQRMAREQQLDEGRWRSVVEVAPRVPRWRYRETLGYVDRIEDNYEVLRSMPSRGGAARQPPWKPID